MSSFAVFVDFATIFWSQRHAAPQELRCSLYIALFTKVGTKCAARQRSALMRGIKRLILESGGGTTQQEATKLTYKICNYDYAEV